MPDNQHTAKAVCQVCPRGCSLAEGQVGFCGARSAKGGAVHSDSYGRLTALALDPIEKKPLARFMPGSFILSAGSYGCNMRCPFCQNHEIAQWQGDSASLRVVSPEALVERALALRRQGNIGIAYTYNEPLVGYEYVRDTARLARRAGLKNVLVTNGYACAGVLEELLPLLDALNIDLKCFTQEGYLRLGGDLDTVKQSITMAARVAHLEVTTLVVPGLSDGEEEMRAEAAFLAGLSSDIPLHLSRYFPRWHSSLPPTDPARIHRLVEVARASLRHVYTGNLG